MNAEFEARIRRRLGKSREVALCETMPPSWRHLGSVTRYFGFSYSPHFYYTCVASVGQREPGGKVIRFLAWLHVAPESSLACAVDIMDPASTIAIRVKFLGDLVAVIGQRELLVTLPEGSTAGDLMDYLSTKYGEAFTCRVFSRPGALHHYILIFVNGRNLKELGGFRAALGNSDVEVIMLPMFEGG